jgi:hypothetical protein
MSIESECFRWGQNGQCGEDCPAFLDGECPTPEEINPIGISPDPCGMEPILIHRGVTVEDDDFFRWAQSIVQEEESKYSADISVRQAPAGRWARWWWRLRMILGRVIPVVRPRPNMILRDCYPVAFPQVDPHGEQVEIDLVFMAGKDAEQGAIITKEGSDA